MFTSISRYVVATGVCIGAVVLVLVGTQVAGASTSTTALLFLACLIPPSLFLLIGSSEPPPTVAEVLYAADTQRETGDNKSAFRP